MQTTLQYSRQVSCVVFNRHSTEESANRIEQNLTSQRVMTIQYIVPNTEYYIYRISIVLLFIN